MCHKYGLTCPNRNNPRYVDTRDQFEQLYGEHFPNVAKFLPLSPHSRAHPVASQMIHVGHESRLNAGTDHISDIQVDTAGSMVSCVALCSKSV